VDGLLTINSLIGAVRAASQMVSYEVAWDFHDCIIDDDRNFELKRDL
jgi:hypothetical protein